MQSEQRLYDGPPYELRVSVIRLLCRSGHRPRVAMRGSSMLPVLHEPMTLEIERASGRPNVGEVVVFEHDGKLVAHRVVAHDGPDLITAGDAVPDVVERVTPAALIGTVARVWSDAGPDARPIDDWRFAVRGVAAAYRRALRLRLGKIRRPVEAVLRGANVRARPRTFAALYDALGAVVSRDAVALEAALRRVEAGRLLAMARRHRCSSMLAEGIEALGLMDRILPYVRAEFQVDRWAAAARASAMRRQTHDVVAALRARNLEPILVNAAARLYGEEPGAMYRESPALDVLLAADRIDEAVAALAAAGYAALVENGTSNPPRAVSMRPPAEGAHVVLHRALATSDVACATDARGMARFLRRVYGAAGTALVLRDLGVALHVLLEAHPSAPLRDVVLIAERLRRLTLAERRELRRLVDGEDARRLRMHAMLYGAARLAGIPWDAPPRARRCFAWYLRRGDLPAPLLARCAGADAYYATGGRCVRPVVDALLLEEDREVGAIPRAARRTLRLVTGVALNACSAAYAALMPEPA